MLATPADYAGHTGRVLGDALRERIQGSADPPRVATVLERLGPTAGELSSAALEAVVAVAGASDSLGDLLVEDHDALDVLADLDRTVALDGRDAAALARSHRLARLRIAARDLLDLDDLVATTGALSALASRALAIALDLAAAPTLVVVGMGKLGAAELNFVSDVDVVLVSSGDPTADERAARRFLEIAGGCFRVDTGLRPEGRDGPLVRSLDGYRAHWERWASAWEFQALLKAAPVAGPTDLQRGFAAAASDALWERRWQRDDLWELRRLKARAEAEVAAQGLSERELKRGPGGIRDIEFSVQLLQLVHGAADPALRCRGTLDALAQLDAGGYVAADEAETLRRAYMLFRDVEHRLQLVHERQTHTVPDDRARRRRIARTLGYRGDADAGPTDAFDHDLAMHRLAVRRVHEGWYFRPLLDAFAGAGTLPDDVTTTRLEAFGFRDAARTRQAVQELASGLTRSNRLMRQLLPLVLDWLSGGPDPDLGLLGLRRLAEGDQRTVGLVSAFRDSAETARRLCDLLTVAPIAADVLVANPDLVERLDDESRLRLLDRDALLASASQAVSWREGADAQRLALQRWHQRHLLGVIARDVAGAADASHVGRDLSALAEAVLETALRLVDPQLPVAVIGMGRLGGRALSYASDVDVVVVYEGRGAADAAEAERVASGVLRLVHGTTPANRTLTVDADLRPEGRQGPLARSLDSYTVYLDRWAEVWERQALLRARPVAGDPGVGQGFGGLVERALWTRPPTDHEQRAVRRMKARVEGERIARGVDPHRHLKLGPGGLADVEWTVQLLQWVHGVRQQATLDALWRLEAIGAIEPDDAQTLDASHRFEDALRNRAWLVFGDGDVLPERADSLATLARALDTTPAELQERHRRLTRRSRRVVERLFYERD